MINNSFSLPTFWGRQRELRAIYNHLISDPPQHCAIIGEIHIGKTTLLRFLTKSQETNGFEALENFTFVYQNCLSYRELSKKGDDASLLFWRELYNNVISKLQSQKQIEFKNQTFSPDLDPIEEAFTIKSELENLLRYRNRVVIILDNFEGVASLPLRDSHWLRSLGQFYCTFIVTSRQLLHLLYYYNPKESQLDLSPFWNMFTNPIFLGLMAENEVRSFLQQTKENAQKQGSLWIEEDVNFIREMAGRHPELLRRICLCLFEWRLNTHSSEDNEFLDSRIDQASEPICQDLWSGLADSEFGSELAIDKSRGALGQLSLLQQIMIAISKEQDDIEQITVTVGRDIVKDSLFVLQQRGLIERVDGKWFVFAQVMYRFILKQERIYKVTETVNTDQIPRSIEPQVVPIHKTHKSIVNSQSNVDGLSSNARSQGKALLKKRSTPVFTHLEAKVYDYLLLHAGKVCNREEIKHAVWDDNLRGNSALQKIIERIRKKLEEDPNNPQTLIAVRGQGFMLRVDNKDFVAQN